MLLANRTNLFSEARRNDISAVIVIFLLPILVNFPGLLGWCSVDPIHFVSGLASFHGKQILPGRPWIDPNVGVTGEAMGKLAADDWLTGRIPWWNYYSGVGLPLAAEMSPAALFLPFALLNHFSNGLLYIKVILQILAGVGTYLLLKRIGLIRLSAVAGAILYEFNGVFAWHGAPGINPIAFLPCLILGIERARDKSIAGIVGGWSTIAIALGFSIYGGFPETAYIDGLLAVVWSFWRIVSIPAQIRYRFIKKLATGVIAGLLLSVPIIIPFVEYVGQSYLGPHAINVGFSGLGLRAEAFPQLFFPWLFGGIFAYSDDGNVASSVWSNVGGFLSAAQLTIIVLGLFITRRCRLYIVLLLWILICLGRTFNLFFVSTLVDLVPLLKQTAFLRYSAPSYEFCSAVLCAIVINEISSGRLRSHKEFIVGLLVAFSIATISLYPARNLVGHLYVQDGYRVFLWISLAWGFGSMVMVVFAIRLGKDRPVIAGRATMIILVIDAIALFSVPSFSGVNSGQSRSAGVSYLKKHIGTDRFYTLGPITPNYGAYYHIASINHNYLPVAEKWVEYIKNHLDPYSDPVCFTGNFSRTDANAPAQANVLLSAISDYEEIGVRYAVTSHSENSLQRIFRLALMNIGNRPLSLANGQSVRGKIFSQEFIGNSIGSVGILIGNYNGESDGLLKIRLCTNGLCAFGEKNLKESKDNESFVIELDQPIASSTGEILYEISHRGGTFPVALWIWPLKEGQQTHSSANIPRGYAPNLEFIHLREADEEYPQRVFESSDMDIYKLSGTKPYFDLAQGKGELHAESRAVVSVNCTSDAELIRRELYYPGWTASVGGKKVDVIPYNHIFQLVKIPRGNYNITFTYTPTHSWVMLASFLLGVFCLIIDFIRKRQEKGTPSR
jgi:hypothetical protein